MKEFTKYMFICTGVGVEMLDLATFSFKSITTPSCKYYKIMCKDVPKWQMIPEYCTMYMYMYVPLGGHTSV